MAETPGPIQGQPTPEGAQPIQPDLSNPAPEQSRPPQQTPDQGQVAPEQESVQPQTGDAEIIPQLKGGEFLNKLTEAERKQLTQGVREYVKERLDVKDTLDLKPEARAALEAAIDAIRGKIYPPDQDPDRII